MKLSTPEYGATAQCEGSYIPADGRFSKEGHAVVAQQLATFVIKHSGRDLNPHLSRDPGKSHV